MLAVSYLCFFFKQKTAYEMRISDWSSDVCSSDLVGDEYGADRQRVRGDQHVVAADQRAAAFEIGTEFRIMRNGGRLEGEHGQDIEYRLDLRGQARRSFLARAEPEFGRADDARRDRQSAGLGQSVSVRVDLGGRRVINKKNKSRQYKSQ